MLGIAHYFLERVFDFTRVHQPNDDATEIRLVKNIWRYDFEHNRKAQMSSYLSGFSSGVG
jgi:hypothetical protein